MDSCITLTFCECSENHVGMEQNGNIAATGYSPENITQVIEYLESNNYPQENIEKYNLIDYLGANYQGKIPELLVIRNLISEHQDLYDNLINISWDRKYFDTRRQKVLNKRARANLCFGESSQVADFENKKGTIVSYQSLPRLLEIKNTLENMIGDHGLQCEGNLYDDITKNGIGWHGDAERKKVIGVRLGTSAPLKFRWYKNSTIVGETLSITLNSGDVYIMTEKTTGNDWKKRNIYTLRHSAISDKYTK